MQSKSAIVRFAWFVLVFHVLGLSFKCGDCLWLSCAPHITSISQTFEWVYCTASGLSILLGFILFFWTKRLYVAGHRVRRTATWALFFMGGEVITAAALFFYTGEGSFTKHPVWVAAHLLSSHLWLAALALVIWFASGHEGIKLKTTGLAGILQLAILPLLFIVNLLAPSHGFAAGFSSTLSDSVLPQVYWYALVVVFALLFLVAYRTIYETRSLVTARLCYWLISLAALQLVSQVIGFFLGGYILPTLMANILWMVTVILVFAHRQHE